MRKVHIWKALSDLCEQPSWENGRGARFVKGGNADVLRKQRIYRHYCGGEDQESKPLDSWLAAAEMAKVILGSSQRRV